MEIGFGFQDREEEYHRYLLMGAGYETTSHWRMETSQMSLKDRTNMGHDLRATERGFLPLTLPGVRN